jgi:pimeloyl-ACP methyl ester carboxylesterase
LEVLPNGGHMPWRVKPDYVAQRVLEFLHPAE